MLQTILMLLIKKIERQTVGSGCGSVASSSTRSPRFESSHRQNLYWTMISIEKMKNKEKEASKGPLKKIEKLFSSC